MRRVFVVTMVVAIFLGAYLPAAHAANYSWTALPDYAGWTTIAASINDSGQIAGVYYDSSIGRAHGYLNDNGSFTQLDFPGSVWTSPNRINSSGQVVGSYGMSVSDEHGFLYSNGSYTTLDYPGGNYTIAYGSNNKGQVVGTAYDSQFQFHSFLCSNGAYSILPDYPGADYSMALGINDSGLIVGSYGVDGSNGTIWHVFLYDGTTFKTLDFPGAGETLVGSGINNQGQVVGNYEDKNGGRHGFLYDGGVFTTLDYPGISWSADSYGLNDINDKGQIVGGYSDMNGKHHAFLATPVPDPSTVLLFGSGLAGIGLLRRRIRARL